MSAAHRSEGAKRRLTSAGDELTYETPHCCDVRRLASLRLPVRRVRVPHGRHCPFGYRRNEAVTATPATSVPTVGLLVADRRAKTLAH